jgi:hypothetical protein
MTAPIIFIHYSDSYYLRYCLESAVIFNPRKQVILLGDASNAHYQKLGVTHYDLSEFSYGPEIARFEDVYQFIAGEEHQRQEWTKFVFRRWFIIYNFITRNQIERFWTFDSDNLVLTDLSQHEEKFRGYDCTEQCSGICMNGFVTNTRVVKGYIEKINELFERTSFLQREKEGLASYPKYAFTEMKAYAMYREECGIKRTRLNAIINSETFLDSICTVEEHRVYFNEDEYEVYNEKLWGNELKKIYLRSDGNIFLLHRRTKQLVKLNTINMSWTPDWLFRILLKHAKRRLGLNIHRWLWRNNMKELDLKKYLEKHEN